MYNPQSSQNQNPYNPQAINAHAPQTSFNTMVRPQGQMNQMMAQGNNVGSYTNTNNSMPNQMITQGNNAGTYTNNSMPNQMIAQGNNAGTYTNNNMPQMVNNTKMINNNFAAKTQEVSFNEMDRKGILAECLYCDKRFTHAGSIRVHLRSHAGFRPFRCSLCNYGHWYKPPILNRHFLNVHGRKGKDAEAVTDPEEEKKMIDKVEEEAKEVRENQRNEYYGQPKKPKKVPDREGGAVNHEYYLGKYDGSQFSGPQGN